MEIALLIVGAILGVVADRLTKVGYPKITEAIREKRLKKRLLSTKQDAVTNWLLSYYPPDSLYHCTISGTAKRLPIFVGPDWKYSADLDSLGDRLTVMAKWDGPEFEIDDKLIRLRERHGQRIFNNETYFISAINERESGPQLVVAPAQYFQVITNLIALEEETFRSVLSPGRPTPIRDKYFPDLETAKALARKPFSFGVNVGFVFRSDTELKVILQVRSEKTVTYGNLKALFPCFGLAPVKSDPSPESGETLWHNFVKEYLEEFFDYEDLVDKLSQRRADQLWFLELPEAAEIVSARRENQLCVQVLGVSMDCLSGTTTLSVLVELNDQGLSRKIMANTIGNWEVAEPSGSGDSLELLDVFSPKLGAYFREDALHYGSAFTLERIQQYYRELGLDPDAAKKCAIKGK